MRILLIGDSITEALDTSKYLPGFDIINRGIYGDNSMGVLGRLEKELSDFLPDIVFVLIGTNDFALGRSVAEIAGTFSELTGIINKYGSGLIACWLSVLPTRNIENRPNERLSDLNSEIMKYALSSGQYYAGLWHFFIADDGSLKDEFTTDGLHLSEAGNRCYARCLEVLFGRLHPGGNGQQIINL